jgi:hypothetical protein
MHGHRSHSHIPTDLVVAQEASAVESGSRLDFLFNWLQVFWNQKLLAAVIKEANGSMREQSGQKNAWHSWAEMG